MRKEGRADPGCTRLAAGESGSRLARGWLAAAGSQRLACSGWLAAACSRMTHSKQLARSGSQWRAAARGGWLAGATGRRCRRREKTHRYMHCSLSGVQSLGLVEQGSRRSPMGPMRWPGWHCHARSCICFASGIRCTSRSPNVRAAHLRGDGDQCTRRQYTTRNTEDNRGQREDAIQDAHEGNRGYTRAAYRWKDARSGFVGEPTHIIWSRLVHRLELPPPRAETEPRNNPPTPTLASPPSATTGCTEGSRSADGIWRPTVDASHVPHGTISA